MLQQVFESTVSALCYEIGWAHEAGAPFNDVTRFVLAQHGRMPRFLALGVKAATLAFAGATLLSTGTRFHRMTPERRRLRTGAWEDSRLGACRNLMKFYRSLAILALYSRPMEPAE